jgi:hypothetical protein
MTRKLHPCARTNAALRREIQESSETNKALAARFGRNIKTIVKWRSRATTSDARKGPRPASTVLSATEEAVIVVFRKHIQADSSPCADVFGPSAWAAEVISAAVKAAATALYNLLMPTNYAAR